MRRWCREQQIPYERMKYWKNRLKESAALNINSQQFTRIFAGLKTTGEEETPE